MEDKSNVGSDGSDANRSQVNEEHTSAETPGGSMTQMEAMELTHKWNQWLQSRPKRKIKKLRSYS